MAAVHFLGEEIEDYIHGYREQIVSFGSGVSISYIFVHLIPEFQRLVPETSRALFAFPLIGFSLLHLVEKHLAKSDVEGEKLRRDFADLHFSFLFFYHLAIGYLIASLIGRNSVSGLLFFLPVMIHVAVSSFSLGELHQDITANVLLKASISLAPVLGVLVYSSGLIGDYIFHSVFGTVIGMFFYVVVRDSIPGGENGKPLEFFIGVVLYLAVIFAATGM